MHKIVKNALFVATGGTGCICCLKGFDLLTDYLLKRHTAICFLFSSELAKGISKFFYDLFSLGGYILLSLGAAFCAFVMLRGLEADKIEGGL